MGKKTKIKAVFIAVLLMIEVLSVYVGYTFSVYHTTALTSEMLESRHIDRADKLMIVAHPDDDVIWGGGHLMEKGYFIVVVTNGRNAVRKQEFEKQLKMSGNDGIILDHPDKTFGKKDEWKKSKESIEKDLEKIISYKDWKLIVTHNSDGEYGHIHHKMTHSMVTDIYERRKPGCDLYYFGKYYTKSKIGDVEASLGRITDEQLEYKEKLEDVYKSQRSTVDMFSHMNPFENWTRYGE